MRFGVNSFQCRLIASRLSGESRMDFPGFNETLSRPCKRSARAPAAQSDQRDLGSTIQRFAAESGGVYFSVAFVAMESSLTFSRRNGWLQGLVKTDSCSAFWRVPDRHAGFHRAKLRRRWMRSVLTASGVYRRRLLVWLTRHIQGCFISVGVLALGSGLVIRRRLGDLL